MQGKAGLLAMSKRVAYLHPSINSGGWQPWLHSGEKFYRDAKLCTIGEGTSEIQKLVISREVLK